MEYGSIGLIDPSGSTVWDSPEGFETTAFLYPAVDNENNVYAVSTLYPTSPIMTVHCFNDEGTEIWSVDFGTDTTVIGCISNGVGVCFVWESGIGEWTISSMGPDGVILWEHPYDASGGKSSIYGIVGFDSTGNILLPYYNYPGGGIDGGIDVLDSTGSLVDSMPIEMNASSGIAESGLIFGIGEISDGRIILSGYERTSLFDNRYVIWDCSNDSLLFLPAYAGSGTPSTYQPANTAIGGNGSIFFMERPLSTMATRITNHSTESGSVKFRIIDTPRTPEIPSGLVYSGFQVACNADRVYIGSASRRPVKGWTLT